jgi:hypothetical protein
MPLRKYLKKNSFLADAGETQEEEAPVPYGLPLPGMNMLSR